MTEPAPGVFALTFGPYRSPTGRPAAVGLVGALTLDRPIDTAGGVVGGSERVRIGSDGTARVDGLVRGLYRMRWTDRVPGGPRDRTFLVADEDPDEVDFDTLEPATGGAPAAPEGHAHDEYVTDEELAAAIAAIPGVDLSGHVTDEQLDAAIAAIPPVDLSGYVDDDELADALDALTPGYITPEERTKLAGVAAGATANATDAALRDRETHTGVQTTASITDLREYIEDTVGGMLQAVGADLDISYDDAAGTLTIDWTGQTIDPETIRDTIGAAMVGLGNISVLVNDAADTITITTSATANATDAALRDRATHTGTQDADTITDGTTNKTLPAALRTLLDGATSSATSDTLVRRSAGGAAIAAQRMTVTATPPAQASELTRKDYVDTGDTAAKARANHTGTQAASTVTGLATVATTGAYADLTGKPLLVLAAGAAVPGGTPAGTVILRTA